MKSIVLHTIFTVVISLQFICAQDSLLPSNSNYSSHFYLLSSKTIGTSELKQKWSSYGGGYDLKRGFQNNWNVELHANVRSWSELSKFVLPVNLGPSYSVRTFGKSTADVFVGLGPVLIIGNDYASIFANLKVGARINMFTFKSFGIFCGIYYSEAMAFHPGAFGHLDIILGCRF